VFDTEVAADSRAAETTIDEGAIVGGILLPGTVSTGSWRPIARICSETPRSGSSADPHGSSSTRQRAKRRAVRFSCRSWLTIESG
jgi:hypothetical protein